MSHFLRICDKKVRLNCKAGDSESLDAQPFTVDFHQVHQFSKNICPRPCICWCRVSVDESSKATGIPGEKRMSRYEWVDRGICYNGFERGAVWRPVARKPFELLWLVSLAPALKILSP